MCTTLVVYLDWGFGIQFQQHMWYMGNQVFWRLSHKTRLKRENGVGNGNGGAREQGDGVDLKGLLVPATGLLQATGMAFSRSGVKVSASASRLGRYSLTDESRRRQRRNTMHGSRAKRGMMMSASLTRNEKKVQSQIRLTPESSNSIRDGRINMSLTVSHPYLL